MIQEPRRARFTSADILTWVGKRAFSKGQEFQRKGNVTRCGMDDEGHIEGQVKITSASRHKVRLLRLLPGAPGLTGYQGACSCVVGTRCEHVAAVLIQLLKESATPAQESTPTAPALSDVFCDWLKSLEEPQDKRTGATSSTKERILYILERSPGGSYRIVTKIARQLANGGYGQARGCSHENVVKGKPAQYVLPVDEQIICELERMKSIHRNDILSRLEGRLILQQVIATERCRLGSAEGPVVSVGPSKKAVGCWSMSPEGLQTFSFHAGENSDIISFDELWYVDLASATVGLVEIELDPSVAIALQKAPTLPAQQAKALREELIRRFPEREDLWPQAIAAPIVIKQNPVPCLELFLVELKRSEFFFIAKTLTLPEGMRALAGRLTFLYGEKAVAANDSRGTIVHLADGKLIHYPRQHEMERDEAQKFHSFGFRELGDTQFSHSIKVVGHESTLPLLVADRSFPTLEEIYEAAEIAKDFFPTEGWRVTVDPCLAPVDFALGTWEAKVDDSESLEWFSVDLGVIVDGERFDLKPILLEFLSEAGPLDWRKLAEADEHDSFLMDLPDGRTANIPARRAATMLGALVELFSLDGSSQVHPAGATALAKLAEHDWVQWKGGEATRALAEKLGRPEGVALVSPPAELKAELRPYQVEGLSWLQFLSESKLGGILADDMGLGKTIQTIAHLLLEKQEGRLQKPCLIVVPTSLVTNWKMELEQWAPSLSRLVLHGPNRKDDFDRIERVDVVLTTYPLLLRDQKVLSAYEFSTIVLDEAQNIKNSKAQVAQAAEKLKSSNKLCLTGTPLENHLGELWSLFRFLMPGFLGSESQFRRTIRNPIEKSNDPEARRLLRSKIAPFILRRTKDQVAKELPSKTTMLEHIELAEGQRDLYEAIRLAMHEKVRQAIAKQGVAKSHILVLDALLKLRQVCCDPRLVKLAGAENAGSSAKLERLSEMLVELISEGRKILLFSQFTSMLELIEQELAKQQIGYVKLTGQTKDRATPIEQFQSGKVPLFLISLKAGGVGLNLTAADTVIHYDPWWNPAVENQATDRAHRIGQDKPVFVYKLITQGTVEQKIAELQERKKEIAAALFNEDGQSPLALSSEDLEMLFQAI